MTTPTPPRPTVAVDSHRYGPQVYLHVEFGVSWNRRPPKSHEVTYRSRNLRERSPHFPRQVPAPNTNYLAAIRDFDQARRGRPARPMQEYYQIAHMPSPPQHEPGDRERLGRADSRGSHERGHSAPPPIGANPWDVSVLGREDGAGAGPSSQPADHWKALPAEPSQFRLGEGGMPWSAWSWPLEYHHADTPSHAGDEAASARTMSTREEMRGAEVAHGATMVSVFSPESAPVRPPDETGRARELAALSMAMMTVDNGFENQWWNQGQREVVRTEESAHANLRSYSTWSPGDAQLEERAASLGASIVSPISVSDRSSIPAFPPLQRSLSTRSEELFFETR
ncbi:hypothetical protein B0T18DRAFT_366763 [Schizothecium vesticola]|uniref:Uncharacterized protein n=1 Tax=Schizothecium vesticola TaxID=314040 RepID=A0AA40K966_9PEZI|nr:hypothetical protein B0T18DRAFT_366763 [Schizothecium vesticola]